jgi:hypothetical protein
MFRRVLKFLISCWLTVWVLCFWWFWLVMLGCFMGRFLWCLCRLILDYFPSEGIWSFCVLLEWWSFCWWISMVLMLWLMVKFIGMVYLSVLIMFWGLSFIRKLYMNLYWVVSMVMWFWVLLDLFGYAYEFWFVGDEFEVLMFKVIEIILFVAIEWKFFGFWYLDCLWLVMVVLL